MKKSVSVTVLALGILVSAMGLKAAVTSGSTVVLTPVPHVVLTPVPR